MVIDLFDTCLEYNILNKIPLAIRCRAVSELILCGHLFADTSDMLDKLFKHIFHKIFPVSESSSTDSHQEQRVEESMDSSGFTVVESEEEILNRIRAQRVLEGGASAGSGRAGSGSHTAEPPRRQGGFLWKLYMLTSGTFQGSTVSLRANFTFLWVWATYLDFRSIFSDAGPENFKFQIRGSEMSGNWLVSIANFNSLLVATRILLDKHLM